MQVLLIGLGAGIVSALLFVALTSGSALSIALFYLAPLPIMLAGLGWSHVAAVTAALVAAAGLGVGVGFWFVLAYLGGVGVPAYTLSYLTMLARPSANGDFEWYPIGRVVLAAAILAAAAIALTSEPDVRLNPGLPADWLTRGRKPCESVIIPAVSPNSSTRGISLGLRYSRCSVVS